jgi:hypothetical protein
VSFTPLQSPTKRFEPPNTEPVPQPATRCAFCSTAAFVQLCIDCGTQFCRRHGRRDLCQECRLEAWLIPTAPDAHWARVGLMVGMVGMLTALGAILGNGLDALARHFWPGLAPGIVAPIAAIVGFGAGWWWFATVGDRWLAEDEADRSDA